MSMIFKIGQNDSLPKLHATLSAEFDVDFPEEERVVHNTNDVFKMYMQKKGETDWVERTATVVKSIGGGKAVKVRVELTPADVAEDMEYFCYFRNETMGLSFPIGERAKIIVEPTGHGA